MAKERYYIIDALRFFCSIVIVFYHYTTRAEILPGFRIPYEVFFLDVVPYIQYGFIVVQIFFVISGFAILNSCIGKTPRQFVTSRILRIYPALFVCCTLSYLILLTFSDTNPSFLMYILNMLNLEFFFPYPYMEDVYWTLLYEIIFYFLIFVLMMTNTLRHYEIFLMGMLLLATFYWFLFEYLGISPPQSGAVRLILLINFMPFFGFFALGSMMFLIKEKGWSYKNIILTLYALVMCFLFFISLIEEYHAVFIHREHIKPMNPWILCGLFFTAMAITFFFVLRNDILKRGRIIMFLGNISYPLYLIHLSLGIILMNLLTESMDKYLALSIVIGLMVSFAAVLHLFGEIPTKHLMQKMVRQLDRRFP